MTNAKTVETALGGPNLPWLLPSRAGHFRLNQTQERNLRNLRILIPP
jgi:hypothetical protein